MMKGPVYGEHIMLINICAPMQQRLSTNGNRGNGHATATAGTPTPHAARHTALSGSVASDCEPVDCSPPGSSVHGISQARTLEWVVMPSSRGLFPTQGLMEKAMAPHSSTLAWKIPWTEEPGGLQSMGSLGVGHD